MKKTFKDIEAEVALEQRRKIASKLPSWDPSGIVVPDSLALEQCSSEAAARFKAGVAVSLCERDGVLKTRIADLTGGMGVDSWAFSKVFGEVLYNEMSLERCEVANSNFNVLGADNIVCTSYEVSEENSEFWTILERFSPDVIFLDPARRDCSGRKVFLLEDCSPDVLRLMPRLLSISSSVLIKVSPMADLVMLSKRIGPGLRSLYVVECGGECKEVLCVVSRSGNLSVELFVSNTEQTLPVGKLFDNSLPVSPSCEVVFASASDFIPGNLLYVPGPSLSKAGRYGWLCSEFGFKMVGRDSHCFILTESSSREALLRGFGKFYSIMDVLPFSSSTIKSLSKKYPVGEVTAHGLPLNSDELRRKTGIKPGSHIHIFALASNSSRLIFVTEPCL